MLRLLVVAAGRAKLREGSLKAIIGARPAPLSRRVRRYGEEEIRCGNDRRRARAAPAARTAGRRRNNRAGPLAAVAWRRVPYLQEGAALSMRPIDPGAPRREPAIVRSSRRLVWPLGALLLAVELLRVLPLPLKHVFIVLFTAVLLAAAVAPAARILAGRGVPRGVTILVIYVG